jgi:hypothetical protein
VAKRGGGDAGRWGLTVLSLLVLALVGSALWARFEPRHRVRTHGREERVVRVQVLNGSGESGIGARVASLLREGGFHVVEVRNADRQDYFASFVVARREDAEPARAVARYLGEPPVIRQAWTADVAEVTVVLGSDRSRLRLD